jgi:transcriptional regulator with XRE-family HTH domain
MSIAPEQCRGARGFLGWSQEDLANASGVGRTTIIDFERGGRKPIASNLKIIQSTLEQAGIEFMTTRDNRAGIIGPSNKGKKHS